MKKGKRVKRRDISSMKLGWFILLITVCISNVNAQEAQAYFDDGGKMAVIDASTNTRLNLFPSYEGFIEARLFETEDGEYMLEILYQANHKILRQRIPQNGDQVRALRERIASGKTQQQASVINQEGRVRLLSVAAGASLGYYAIAVPIIAKVEGRAAVGLYLLTGGLGFYVPYQITKNMSITHGAADGYTYGLFHGAGYGAAINFLASGGDITGRQFLFSTSVGSIAGSILGYQYAKRNNLSSGDVAVYNIGGLYGTGMGLGAAALTETKKSRIYAASGLVGNMAGLVIGHSFLNAQHYTSGDMDMVMNSGALGAYLLPSVLLPTKLKDNRIYIAATMTGGTLGLMTGNNLIRGKDFTASQSRVIALGGAAGLLTGAGIAYLVAPEDKPRWYVASSAVGGLIGFSWMYASNKDKVEHESGNKTSLKIRFMPENYLMAKLARHERNSPGLPIITAKLIF